MKIRLNDEAVNQLTSIMERTGYTNTTHTIQCMISTIYNNLNKKHKSPTSEDSHGNQSSKRM